MHRRLLQLPVQLPEFRFRRPTPETVDVARFIATHSSCGEQFPSNTRPPPPRQGQELT